MALFKRQKYALPLTAKCVILPISLLNEYMTFPAPKLIKIFNSKNYNPVFMYLCFTFYAE